MCKSENNSISQAYEVMLACEENPKKERQIGEESNVDEGHGTHPITLKNTDNVE